MALIKLKKIVSMKKIILIKKKKTEELMFTKR